MHYGPDLRPLPIENAVHFKFTGGLASAVHHVAVQIHDYNVFRRQGKIIHSAGADGHQLFFRIKNADIAAGALGQAMCNQHFQMLDDFLSFFFHQHIRYLRSVRQNSQN